MSCFSSKGQLEFSRPKEMLIEPNDSGSSDNKCKQCDFTTSNVEILRIHMKTHRGRKQTKCKHCTMRFRKKRAKNVQLWTLVSPWIFIEKSWNFAQSCLNSSRIWGLFFSEEKLRKKWGKNPKTCWGCLRKSRLVSKKSSRKKNFFL